MIKNKVVEWLLVGGPGDGKKLTILYGKTVKFADKNGSYWLYNRRDYSHHGRLYCLGIINMSDVEPGKVGRMIYETNLRPIDGERLGIY